MPKVIFFLVAVIFVSSCSVLSDIKYSEMLGGYELSEYDYGEIETHKDIVNWIDKNILYFRTPDLVNPQETINNGYGGCFSQAILYMDIAYNELGIEMDLILTDYRSIEDGGIVHHAEVRHNGVNYSVSGTEGTCETVGYVYSFDEVFKR